MPGAWLFTKSDQSIHVVRPEGCPLVIHGPGKSRLHHDFHDEGTLQVYQISMAERLAESGWILYGVDRQRRMMERRAVQRGTADRRG